MGLISGKTNNKNLEPVNSLYPTTNNTKSRFALLATNDDHDKKTIIINNQTNKQMEASYSTSVIQYGSRAITLYDCLVKSVILFYACYLLREFMVRLRPMLGYLTTVWLSTGPVNCPDHRTLANVLHFGSHAAAAVASAVMLSCSSSRISSTTYGVMKYFLVFW